MACYLKEHAAHSPSKEWIGYTSQPILDWWAGKTLADVNGTQQPRICDVAHRADAPPRQEPEAISTQTTRHELKTLHKPPPQVLKIGILRRAAADQNITRVRQRLRSTVEVMC
jgi:hypothetical protein